jgi:hypothetical protein
MTPQVGGWVKRDLSICGTPRDKGENRGRGIIEDLI